LADIPVYLHHLTILGYYSATVFKDRQASQCTCDVKIIPTAISATLIKS